MDSNATSHLNSSSSNITVLICESMKDASICARLRQEQQSADENPFVYFFGYVYLVLSLLVLTPSLLVISILLRPSYLKKPLSQLLAYFFLLVTANTILTGLSASFYSLSHCDFFSCDGMSVVGSLQVGAWTAFFMATSLLLFNRIVVLSSKKMKETLFTGRRTLGWAFLASFFGAQMLIPIDGEPFYHYDSSEAIWNYELVPLGTKHVRFIVINSASIVLNLLLSIIVLLIVRCQGNQQNEKVESSYFVVYLCIPVLLINVDFLVILNVTFPSFALNVALMSILEILLGVLAIICLLKNRAINDAIAGFCCCCRFRKPTSAATVYAPSGNFAPAEGHANHVEIVVTGEGNEGVNGDPMGPH
ncbi:hypothetical protein L596_018166 [Steinernema carpocapsae]|uniref:G-protein coupled receptors family 1 profile domain-containing protein n=1 Tax=Steinernema carpocapsae TaxID=34508 RepID=A0A4U5N4L5_STECR|nr:hypothetical protein L596_018166 [Steinernema carpocapsae]